uniref:Ethylene-responsive transcription factor RAP2-7 isoform X4 n=1 Tax=Rhizophora mucronata TaxID=61149 RepID=A0A2P2JQS7_RHIMU
MPFQHIGRSDVFSGPLKGRSPIIVAIEFSICRIKIIGNIYAFVGYE